MPSLAATGSRSRIFDFATSFALALLAAFFRFYRLASLPPGLYNDEAVNGNDAVRAFREDHWSIFYPANNGREGLFINLQSFSIALFGPTPWALRAVAAAFGVVAVLGVYYVGRRLLTERQAVLAGVFQAVLLWPVITSRIGLRADMAAAIFVWLAYWALKAYYGSGRQRFAIAATGVLLGLGFHSYLAFRVAPLFVLGLAISAYRAKQPSVLRTTLWIAAIALLIASPLFFYLLAHPELLACRTEQISIFAAPRPVLHFFYNIWLEAQMYFWRGDRNWRHNFGGAPMLFWLPAICFASGIICLLLRCFAKRSKEPTANVASVPFILFLWIVLGSLPGLLSQSADFPHGLRLILIAPAVMLIAAIGFDTLLGRLRNSGKWLWIVYALVITFTIAHEYERYFVRYAARPEVKQAFLYPQYELAEHLLKTQSKKRRVIAIPYAPRDGNGLPLLANTIAFLTETATPEAQDAKNIHYAPAAEAPRGDSVELYPLPVAPDN